MTKRYDGYHFSEFLSDGIYNPFSVLNALVQKRFSSYWFATGTPTMLVDMLKKTDYDLRQLDGIEVPAAALIDYRADFHNPVPIIYQSGYLTIKGEEHICDKIIDMLLCAEERAYISVYNERLEMFREYLEKMVSEGKKVVIITNEPFDLQGANCLSDRM